MTEKFVKLADQFFVSPQITAVDLDKVKALGVTAIVNNRPDGEAPGQPDGASIAAAAQDVGLAYRSIPMGPAGLSMDMLDELSAAISSAEGAVLAYCASGTRSAILHALVEARTGRDIDDILANAANAGFNLSGQRALLQSVQGA